MQIYRPPDAVELAPGTRSIFFAGSIEMGTATHWQKRLVEALGDRDIAVLDPRRDAWDASWVQSIDNPQFREQVEWELDNLDRAEVIAMWFEPQTKSPITLLELGLHAKSGKLIVGCPDGFWRKGNVEVVCARHAIPLLGDWQAFVTAVCARL